jgi:hypothetical protein
VFGRSAGRKQVRETGLAPSARRAEAGDQCAAEPGRIRQEAEAAKVKKEKGKAE